MTSIYSLPATGAALPATWRTRSAATRTRICDPEPFSLRVASLHGSHDECASIKRPLSKLRDILVRICSDLSRNVVIDDRFCKEILKEQAACIVQYGVLSTTMTIRHPVSLHR